MTSSGIGPTPTATVLIAITAVAFFGADIVATKIATGAWQLVPRGRAADRGSYLVIQITTLAAILIAAWSARRPGGELPGPAWAWVGAGLSIAWTGIVIRVSSVLVIGGEFRRVLTEGGDQRLVTDGPFRWVRHPSYTGVPLAFAGIGVALDDGIALLALGILPAIGYAIGVRTEEPALERTFGETYRSYASGRARLVPGVC